MSNTDASVYTLMPFKQQLDSALWVDVNPQFGLNGLPELLPDEQAILVCSLYNLFNCPIGARGRIFQPTYGCDLYKFLQEPMDDITAFRIRAFLIQAIEKWETRIRIDQRGTKILTQPSLPGYKIVFAYTYLLTNTRSSASFLIPLH